jgi:hypothetical protein
MLMAFVYLAVIFALAYLAESLTEYLFGIPFDKIPKLTPFKWTLMYLSAGVGVGMAVFYKLDLVSLLAEVISEMVGVVSPIPVTVVGFVLTGLGIGRGANWMHDFVSKYFKKPVIQPEADEPAIQ